MPFWKNKKSQNEPYLPSLYILSSLILIYISLPILIIVKHLHCIIVYFHDSILWIFIWEGGNTRGNEIKGSKLIFIAKLRNKTNMISMSMTIKLSSNDVAVSFRESVKPHWPVIKGWLGTNVPNYINKLSIFLWLLKLIFYPV